MRIFLAFMTFLAVGSASNTASACEDGFERPDGVKISNSFEGGLPECRFAAYASEGDIAFAYYDSPTTRYRHGILGDAIEAGSLVVIGDDQKEYRLALPDDEVFEDIEPRLVDLDGDGLVEVVTIRASVRAGAAVTVYGLENGQLIQKATTEFHGRANRWLNIAGFGDFRGVGTLDIAFVRTPHIGGTLFFYSYSKGVFKETAKLSGFSNHQIGSRELRLSAIADFDGDQVTDIVVPSADRNNLSFVQIKSSKLVEFDRIALPSSIDKNIDVVKNDAGISLKVGMRDGTVFKCNALSGLLFIECEPYDCLHSIILNLSATSDLRRF